ncbi:MAG TPA: hypothetical protein PL078_06215 [Bacillota bacterium]|mgnify:CR=1 FL=1|nr:hypothetical protein [Bacillota bacterium]HQD75984.1 hypothetical protein [Bacillota bacterium]HUM58313.1 hypothetical protein [Bacillota bacterium]
MLVKLSDEERRRIMDALYIARHFYEKTKRKDDYFEVDDLVGLLFFAGEIIVNLSDDNVTYYTENAKKLKDLLAERDAKLKAKEQGCKVYQFKTMPEGPEDPDDPDGVKADIRITRRMKEIAKEHPEL